MSSGLITSFGDVGTCSSSKANVVFYAPSPTPSTSTITTEPRAAPSWKENIGKENWFVLIFLKS